MKPVFAHLPQGLVAPHGCAPGAEPIVHAGSRRGVLVLHGFTGSPWEVRPVAEAMAAQGFTVAAPVLAGHATSVVALNESNWHDWLQTAERALGWLDERCDQVDIVGFSMGGLLASILASRRSSERPARLVLLAPAFAIYPYQRVAVTMLGRLGWPASLGKSDPRLPNGQKLPTYMAVPLRATLSFLQLQEVARRVVVQQPALVFQGESDLTVPCQRNLALVRRVLGASTVVQVMPRAGHILARTQAGPELIRRTLDYLNG